MLWLGEMCIHIVLLFLQQPEREASERELRERERTEAAMRAQKMHRLKREDIERMLNTLRARRERSRVNPQYRLTCRADMCLPPPVPTEHREQALLVLLNKMVSGCFRFCNQFFNCCKLSSSSYFCAQVEAEEYRGGVRPKHRHLDGVANVLNQLRDTNEQQSSSGRTQKC